MTGESGEAGTAVASSELFYLHRFRKVGEEELRDLLRESGQWKYGELVLATRSERQLRNIYREAWLKTLGQANIAKLQEFGTLPGPYPRTLPDPEEAGTFSTYRWSPEK